MGIGGNGLVSNGSTSKYRVMVPSSELQRQILSRFYLILSFLVIDVYSRPRE